MGEVYLVRGVETDTVNDKLAIIRVDGDYSADYKLLVCFSEKQEGSYRVEIQVLTVLMRDKVGHALELVILENVAGSKIKTGFFDGVNLNLEVSKVNLLVHLV